VKNNRISSTSPTFLPAAERGEDERSEAVGSTAAGKTAAPQPPPPRPDPVVDAKGRTFTAEYKLQILAEADAAPDNLAGALQRREGLYSSDLVTWRVCAAGRHSQGLDPTQTGPKSGVN
jgi:transposase